MTEKEMFLQTWEREFPTTLKVLKAFPPNKGDFKPHERSLSAKQLGWIFVQAQVGIDQVLKGTFTLPPQFPPVPETWEEVLMTYEKSHNGLVSQLRKLSDADLNKPMQFLLGPGKMGEIPKMQFMWFVLSDNIHHRGQLSVYVRMAGGKVPSIYGPSADEPWM